MFNRYNVTVQDLKAVGYHPDFSATGVHSLEEMVTALRSGDRYCMGYIFTGRGGVHYVTTIDNDGYVTGHVGRDFLPGEDHNLIYILSPRAAIRYNRYTEDEYVTDWM